MLIFSTLCLLFFMGNTFVLTRGCDTGWFGDKCQYKCHCESTCDISGDCVDHNCSPGWFGYKCQYRDLVHLSKNNINKSRGNIDTKTCIELDSNNDNITLQWDDLYVFTWLRIALKQEISELITDLLILFRQDINKTVSYVPCQNKLFYVIKPQTIDVRCDFNGTFKELVLKGRTIQWICTLNINGGRNVALKQSTTQSGTYTDRSHTEEYSNSSNAVDGKALYSFKEKSCAHPFSGNRKQFWSVKFPHRVVTGYVLYDRQDGAENFNGFKLTASTGNEIQFEYIDEKLKVPKRIYTIPHPRKSPVSNVTIYRDGTLNLCEVEVYGECPSGTWGLNCSQCTTQCPHNCQVDDGSCEILCPGFSNPPFCNQTCESGWFGDGCKYQCHCKEKCDTSGYCTNNKCSDGWFGYKCQYRDLMYLANLEANRVIFDNNDDTCITSKPDSILIRWKEAYVFTWLRIVVKNETFITDLKIQFQKNEKQSTQFLACQNQRMYLVDSKTMDVWCDLNDTFHQLTLTGKAILSLCTLNVNGGRNLALKQNTSQSGTYSNARSKEDAAQSSNAVDGKVDAKYFTFKEKSCAHTAVGDKNPFWSVQFLPHLITEYVLYDRRDRNVDNLIGFTLTAFPRTDESFYFQDKNVAVEKKIYRLLDPRKNIVSNVTITRKNYLNICEVEIYGECPPGTWGLACTNCSQPCPNECHVEDGRCVNLCLGFTNPPSCDLPCEKTEYGINCTKHCSDNCKNNECDSQTGECLECSGNGTYSGTCDKRCDNSYWGEFCNESCSLNCANQTCDQKTGDCNGGCNEGYKPPNCMESCSLGNYGFNCSENCSSQCRNNSGCEPISGECIDGCEDGYAGPNCNRNTAGDTTIRTTGNVSSSSEINIKEEFKNLYLFIVTVVMAAVAVALTVSTTVACYRYYSTVKRRTKNNYDELDIRLNERAFYHTPKLTDPVQTPSNVGARPRDVTNQSLRVSSSPRQPMETEANPYSEIRDMYNN